MEDGGIDHRVLNDEINFTSRQDANLEVILATSAIADLVAGISDTPGVESTPEAVTALV